MKCLSSNFGILLVILLIKTYCASIYFSEDSEDSNETLKQEQIRQIVAILNEDYYYDIGFIIEGTYGKLFKASRFSLVKPIALKVFIKEPFLFAQIMNEISILEKLNHPNIISGRLFSNRFFYYLEMDFFEYDLLGYVKRNFLSIFDKKIIVKQIIDALYYLKLKKIIHNDLKNNNILIDENLNIKICDFGLACYKSRLDFPFNNISPSALEEYEVYSPELKQSIEYDEKSDIYSFGILTYFIFQEFNSKFETFIPISDSESNNMFLECIEYNPMNRPSVESLLLSAYFDFLYDKMFCFGKLEDFTIETETGSIIKKDKKLTINIKSKRAVEILCCCHILTSLRYTSKAKKLNLTENRDSHSNLDL
ncbi:protein kinase, partial [Hamiltosporidium magnivora]